MPRPGEAKVLARTMREELGVDAALLSASPSPPTPPISAPFQLPPALFKLSDPLAGPGPEVTAATRLKRARRCS
eukprot:1718864-Rhodomonas_salina.1